VHPTPPGTPPWPVAMRAYARQAKDTELVGSATDIRLRAERRTGEPAEMKEQGVRHKGEGQQHETLRSQHETLRSQPATVSLPDLGVTKSQSSRQPLAALPGEQF
jgi:hypothetical protein